MPSFYRDSASIFHWQIWQNNFNTPVPLICKLIWIAGRSFHPLNFTISTTQNVALLLTLDCQKFRLPPWRLRRLGILAASDYRPQPKQQFFCGSGSAGCITSISFPLSSTRLSSWRSWNKYGKKDSEKCRIGVSLC